MYKTLLTLLMLTSVALAGCTDDGDGSPEPTQDQGDTGLPQLHGWVFDPALRPMPGVSVQAIDSNRSAVTDGDGFFGFDALATEQPLVLVARLEGYEASSKQVTIPQASKVRLNFTLVPLPVKTPTSEVLDFNGFIACQATTVASGQTSTYDCSGGESDNVWEFSASPDLAGAVIEIAWDAGTPAADSFSARLESMGLGDFDLTLAESVGTSVLRLQVPQGIAEKYYGAGGRMRLTVDVEPNVQEEEVGIGVGTAVNQEFQAFASLFYVEPPPGDYSVENRG